LKNIQRLHSNLQKHHQDQNLHQKTSPRPKTSPKTSPRSVANPSSPKQVANYYENAVPVSNGFYPNINIDPINFYNNSEIVASSQSPTYVDAQADSLEFWKLRIAQEEEDRLLALKLMNEEKQKEKQVPKWKPNEDERMAIELQKKFEEEEKKLNQDAALADKLLAQELERQEKEAEEEIRKKKEWEETLDMIKLEAKAESDEALARLLKEKEELASQLEQMRIMESEDGGISLNGIEYPDYWNRQVNDFQTFDVAHNSQEFHRVEKEFKQGLPQAKITRLERNQNRTLWTFYYLKKSLVSKSNRNPNEQFLFHGSRNDAYDIILKEGLDHRVANLGGSIGAGIYFAPNSGTSSGYVSANGRSKKMLYCRVTLGEVGPGAHGLRRPPEKSKGRLFDSVGQPGSMFVIFDNHQSYPEYVIHYT